VQTIPTFRCEKIVAPVVWMHHESDKCPTSRYSDARLLKFNGRFSAIGLSCQRRTIGPEPSFGMLRNRRFTSAAFEEPAGLENRGCQAPAGQTQMAFEYEFEQQGMMPADRRQRRDHDRVKISVLSQLAR
jgi:hypothetical protein